MLVLGRKLGDEIFIGDNIVITITDISRGIVRIGIQAPEDVAINRREILSPETVEKIQSASRGHRAKESN